MAFCQLWMAIELEEFLCMLIWGFCFQSSIANFKLHPGEYEYGPAELAGSVVILVSVPLIVWLLN